MIEPHWHWEFVAFDHPEAQPVGEIHWPVTVNVTGQYDEETASLAARSIITREHFKLRRVTECTTCGYQEQIATSTAKLAKAAEQ